MMRGEWWALAPCVLAIVITVGEATTFASDWPAYGHDSARSGATDEQLEFPLDEVWTYRSAYPPIPAWPGPAKLDGYNKVYDLSDRMIFDKAFQVAVVDGRVFFGSSVDDQLHCLDAATGDSRWTFFTEGPVRLAPTVAAGRVYVGSDDGYVYSLATIDGAMHWKHRGGPSDLRVPGNGRLISLWPIRSSVVVEEGKAYASAGVFPSETVYLFELDALTGKETWRSEMNDLPSQGYMLASSSKLYVPAGRERPVVFDRKNGKRLYQVKGGGGGTYALLTGDDLVYGPGKSGQLSATDAGHTDQVASFSGNAMVVAHGRSYLLDAKSVSMLDRTRFLELARERNSTSGERNTIAKQVKEKGKSLAKEELRALRERLGKLGDTLDRLSREMAACEKWRVPCDASHLLIVAGSTLFAGGDGKVRAFDTDTGRELWSATVEGGVYGLAAAHSRLFVSTDRGAIHCFASRAAGAGR